MPDYDDDRQRRDLERILQNFDQRLQAVERQVAVINERQNHGISGGARRELDGVKKDLDQLWTRLNEIGTQTNRIQGGNAVIYAIVTIVGGFIGWVLSHLGVGK